MKVGKLKKLRTLCVLCGEKVSCIASAIWTVFVGDEQWFELEDQGVVKQVTDSKLV